MYHDRTSKIVIDLLDFKTNQYLAYVRGISGAFREESKIIFSKALMKTCKSSMVEFSKEQDLEIKMCLVFSSIAENK